MVKDVSIMKLPSLLIAAFALASSAFAQTETQKPRAARSVHLWWPAPKSDTFINEMTVEQSTLGSYFMACGFSNGYFGIQELGDGRKVVLFSVWDPGNAQDLSAKQDAVPQDQRVEVLHSDADVKVERFGWYWMWAQALAPSACLLPRRGPSRLWG